MKSTVIFHLSNRIIDFKHGPFNKIGRNNRPGNVKGIAIDHGARTDQLKQNGSLFAKEDARVLLKLRQLQEMGEKTVVEAFSIESVLI